MNNMTRGFALVPASAIHENIVLDYIPHVPAMSLLTLGLSHRTAPLAVRERVTFADGQLAAALNSLMSLPGLSEGMILSTCNRTEIHTVSGPEVPSGLRDWLGQWHGLTASELDAHLYVHRERDAVQHILRVACGLDSMVLGEPQILGQMKQAFRLAQQTGSLGPTLSRLFQHGFAVAKEVRTDTAIGAQPVSVAFAAVGLARRIFDDLGQATALMVGAGDTNELAARHLRTNGLGHLVIANRSLARARRLAERFQGSAIPLDALPRYLPEADIVIASTASRQPLITMGMVRNATRARRHKPVFLLDLAVPRDIEPAVADLEDAYLYTLDDLQEVIRAGMRSRETAALRAESIVSERAEDYMTWLRSRLATDTIRALRERAQTDRDDVLAKAQRRIARGQSPDEALRFLADTLTNRLLHAPSARLRQADHDRHTALLDSARVLFDLDTNRQRGGK